MAFLKSMKPSSCQLPNWPNAQLEYAQPLGKTTLFGTPMPNYPTSQVKRVTMVEYAKIVERATGFGTSISNFADYPKSLEKSTLSEINETK